MAQKKKGVKFGFLFWVVFILLVLLLFFVNKDNIKNVLNQTGAGKLLKDKVTEVKPEQSAEAQIQAEIERLTDEAENIDTKNQSATIDVKSQADSKPKAIITEKAEPKKQEKPVTPAKTDTLKSTEEKKPAEKKTASKTESSDKTEKKADKSVVKKETVNAVLYFVLIDGDGKISRMAVTRNLPKSDSPMSDALKALFGGTNEAEAKKGYKSLIPSGTKLLGAYVKDGVAYINVSEAFEFNQYGIEGYLGQLSQIIFTATEYPTVKSVQFLIEGKQKEFLGAEAIWIGSPQTRSSF